MLIDREIIQKAKRKLGDENAALIAEALHLDDFDEKHMKSCCPFHHEDTPSFIYNPKAYNMHCFGCSRTVDLIDAYMESGDTYVEAVQKLLDKADIVYPMGEIGVKTKREYRYPHEEKSNMDSVYQYLGIRGISKQIVDNHDIGADQHGNIAFHYYDTNNVLTMVKYRPSHRVDKSKGEAKNWAQKDADTTPLLFNMNRINIESPLVICEGEIDALAVMEAGYPNAVSVPFGAGNFGWIDENWDWLEQFESIIICSDNDDPGIKMQKECLSRLGTWRTKFVEVPEFYTDEEKMTKRKIKDMNEVLYFFGKHKVLELIMNAKESPIESVIDLTEIKGESLEDMDGIETGLLPLDREVGKLYYGTLNIMSGSPGSGKSSLIYQMACNAMDAGIVTWIYSGEFSDSMTRDWFEPILAGPRHMKAYQSRKGDTYYRVDNAVLSKINSRYKGMCYLYRDDHEGSLTLLMKSMEEVVRRYGAKFIIMDNMSVIDTSNPDEELLEQKEIVKRLLTFARKYNVAILLVAHPRKMQTGAKVSLYDVAGSSVIVNLAHRSLALKRVTDDERSRNAQFSSVKPELRQYDVVFTINKDRMRGRSNIDIGLYYDKASRRFYTSKEELDRQYSWDTGTYTQELPYEKPDDSEVFV